MWKLLYYSNYGPFFVVYSTLFQKQQKLNLKDLFYFDDVTITFE